MGPDKERITGATIDIHLFGSLQENLRAGCDLPLRLEIGGPIPLLNLLHILQIRHERVKLAMVNYRSVPKETVICPGDRLSLFPQEYPIFADWKDHCF